ncbi:MAG: flagellar motor stator protein MotA [Thermodesulfovibrionales bacterium]|nr:flagellar motor stator protein MotA [Thermodesulfovibrionales bacterium]
MFAIIGILVVSGSVVGGYLMVKGNLSILFQPAEFLIIVGAAIGGFLISSPPKVTALVAKSIGRIFAAKNPSKTKYLELLTLLYQLFSKIRKEGLISLEADVETPQKSPLFKKYPNILKDHHLIDFICDNLKVIITTNVPPHELDNLMELEMETHHTHASIPAGSINKVADSLPGLGIVAAVLGVVITMQYVDSPPAVLGNKIAAALVGTFLGVLLCYGYVGPMAANLEHQVREEAISYNIIRVSLVSFVGGAAPQVAVEFGRRAIPGKEKPSFSELEKAIRGAK